MNRDVMNTMEPFRFVTLPGGFQVGGRLELSTEQREQIIAIISGRSEKTGELLRGRANVVHTEIAGIGRVVVKRFMRGGLFRFLIRQKYFRYGTTRAESEFKLLEKVRSLGVHAPEPVICIYRGWPLYDAWLITREVPDGKNFAEMSRADEHQIYKYADEIVRQISILIRNRILHVDLHPGNVIVDPQGVLYLVDFDKACTFHGALNSLRDHYLVRWRRAVIKHRLPEALSERICPGLRRNYSEVDS